MWVWVPSTKLLFFSYSFYILPFSWPKMIEASWIQMYNLGPVGENLYLGWKVFINIDVYRLPEHRPKLCFIWSFTIIIKLSYEGPPNRPYFPPRNRALNVKGEDVIEVHRRNSVFEISTCVSVWTLTWVGLAPAAAAVLRPPSGTENSNVQWPCWDRGKWALLQLWKLVQDQ